MIAIWEHFQIQYMYYDGFSLGRVKQDNMSDICLKVDTCILF